MKQIQMKLQWLSSGFVTVVLTFVFFQSAAAENELHQPMHRYVKSYYEAGEFQGAVLVAKEGAIVYQHAFGWADKAAGIQNTLRTRFLIGSTTKSFTAATALQFVDDGLLDLNQPIGAYLPTIKKAFGEHLTVHRLLKMQSGLPAHLGQITELKYEDISAEELIELINRAELTYPPGTEYNYSNINYALVALILQAIAKKSFADILQERVFDPLDMKDSGVERSADVIPGKARGYERTASGHLKPAQRNYMAYAIGSGDIYSTLGDLLKWDQALYGAGYLSDKSKALAFDGHPSEDFGHYGYGFRVKEYVRFSLDGAKGKLVRHGGSMQGYLANVHRYLDDRLTIIVLGNMRPFPVMDISFGLKEIMFGRAGRGREGMEYRY